MINTMFSAEDMLNKRVMYKKHNGNVVQMQILATYTMKSLLMCGGECVGNTDCFAFRVVDDEHGLRCDLMKEGAGVPVRDFFSPVCL